MSLNTAELREEQQKEQSQNLDKITSLHTSALGLVREKTEMPASSRGSDEMEEHKRDKGRISESQEMFLLFHTSYTERAKQARNI